MSYAQLLCESMKSSGQAGRKKGLIREKLAVVLPVCRLRIILDYTNKAFFEFLRPLHQERGLNDDLYDFGGFLLVIMKSNIPENPILIVTLSIKIAKSLI